MACGEAQKVYIMNAAARLLGIRRFLALRQRATVRDPRARQPPALPRVAEQAHFEISEEIIIGDILDTDKSFGDILSVNYQSRWYENQPVQLRTEDDTEMIPNSSTCI